MSAPKKLTKIADLVPDNRNLNLHTERGVGLLAKSIEQFGAGRSIVVDKHGKVIAGNATLEVAADRGLDVQVVPTDGKTLVVVQRTDLELETPEGRGLALADNRVAEVDLAWDPAQLRALAEEGLDVGAFFLPDELEKIFKSAPALDGTPALSPELSYAVLVQCADEQEQAALLAKFDGEGLKCRALIS